MKVLLSWLQEFAPVDGDPADIGDQLSALGLAIESMSVVGEGLDGIVVARVLEVGPHPDADRIQLVQVDAGDGEALQICCGAFNMSVGDLVPLATLGTVMPDGMEIARRKMRGEWSNGMLCSPTEIAMGDDHDGILLLDGSLEVGRPLAEAMGLASDVLFDLEVNPNRPDAMSVAGVARDLAACQGVPFTLPSPNVAESGSDAAERLSVEILDPVLCGRFVARVLDGITIGSSPAWMANRLTSLGMRPINSVVDVSNYVMLELGQPSHTYDLDMVAGSAFRVRRALPGETLVTLDGVERTLTEADGVVADAADTAIGIAGVMGGASTEIHDGTSSVALEMAWWDPMSIATSARRLGLRSEASARFEKGADPEVADLAMRRFAQLLGETGASLAPGTVDVRGDTPVRESIRVRTDRVNRILGTDLSRDRIAELLDSIEFATRPADDDLDVVVPSFRPDSATEIDVIEEVARIHGYGAIERTTPRSTITGSLTQRQLDRRTVRTAMIGMGLDEVMPIPFLAPGDLARAGLKVDGITVTNPLVAEESVMRASLRPGLLATLAYNASHRMSGLGIFEVGHVYRQPDQPQPLPDEREYLAVALAGRDATDAVGVWSALADALAARDYTLVADDPAGLHPTRTARIDVAGVVVGHVGEVDPGVLAAFDVPERVAWLEVDLETLLGLPHGEKPYGSVSRYPSSDIDLAFEVDDDVPAAEVEQRLRGAAGDLLVDLSLFDVFRGAPVGEGRRSLAFTLRFQADDRTLTDSEVSQVRQACIDAVEGNLPANLRA
ncbi:MAG: phenylalanine--tRNA ligase subunit beta [Actinobacteria bacterium]|jgi:phenylalanyl-tRNA synthetase beta chain|nr:phenylalanine--tRNA ligase subunit beta [Actinomycetota bacterium]MBT3687648.1 phenylalanine--tRNA ligase subunit beta [Actinomycetota bacterium]MBT4038151.1 phenylalanine--tRNA ligase subunit beta [Actinomycetota bacterium]MBT4278436.1 phenylalanine--tRNA ligase subunit beta [Actinomycetota bacterium]MBT4344011.1 phenylalanine--tRNA ligase subunit beta [Actinomycetota bacterium]